ncbi:MAG: hypothetical protein QM753_10975 [Thermomicrobiales bacterium]
MSAHRDLRHRLLRGSAALLIAGSIAGPGLAHAQEEAPTAETEIVVSVTNEGSLAVSWASTDIAFTADGEQPSISASSPTPYITATLSLAIADTRGDGSRAGYTIVLHATDLTTEGGSAIAASALQVESVTGAPSSAVSVATQGASFANAITVLTVPDGAPAATATIDIVVGTTLEPTTAGGTYTGTFTFDVLPVTETAP